MARCGESYGLAAFGKERLDHGGALGRQNAGGDFYLVVEAPVREDFEAGADGAAFGVVGAVDKTRDSGLDDGAGTHAAGLDGYVERGVGKAVVAEQAGGFAENNDFGVGGGVTIANGAVAGSSEDLAIMDEDGADGDFAGFGSCAGLRERYLHELDVSFHVWREDNTREE
jgi:hypothetical protein